MTAIWPEMLNNEREKLDQPVTSAERVEDLLPALEYAQLIANLGAFTRLGAFEEGSLAGALAVARLMDRGRILRSGIGAREIQRALERYRRGRDWRPVPAIERALEQAVVIAAGL